MDSNELIFAVYVKPFCLTNSRIASVWICSEAEKRGHTKPMDVHLGIVIEAPFLQFSGYVDLTDMTLPTLSPQSKEI